MCAAWPKLQSLSAEGPDPVLSSLRYPSPPSQGFPGQGLSRGGSLLEVEERERQGWSGVEGLVPGTWENGVPFRLPTSVNPHFSLTFPTHLSPGNRGDQKTAPKAGVQR